MTPAYGQLLTLPADTLLAKFGSGTHAPGSGSAAALMGLLSSKLILTVSQLTLAKAEYSEHHKLVRTISTRVESELCAELTQLFEEDAKVFDRVIVRRRARDAATTDREKRRLAQSALDELKVATAIPFRVAECCLELIELSAKLFDIGFRGARGDTGAALSAAAAGVLSAVFVINLNLKSFRGSYWARQRRRDCDRLQTEAAEKYQAAMLRIVRLRTEDIDALLPIDSNEPSLSQLWDRVKRNSTETSAKAYGRDEIERYAEQVRKVLWRRQSEVWPETVPVNPVDMLEPSQAIRLLGYQFEEAESLGTFGNATGVFEVAGLLEAQTGLIRVSHKMSPAVRRFTAAHELGHIILHPHLREAHRDRPIDGSTVARDPIEREADFFASSYLMPPKLLRKQFRLTFGISAFVLSEATAFALTGKSLADTVKLYPTARDVSRGIARAKQFNGKQIVTLAEQFHVSEEAMAIRLEELQLVDLG